MPPELSGLARYEHLEEGSVITSGNANVSTWLADCNLGLHHVHTVQPQVGSDGNVSIRQSDGLPHLASQPDITVRPGTCAPSQGQSDKLFSLSRRFLLCGGPRRETEVACQQPAPPALLGAVPWALSVATLWPPV